MYIGCQFDTLFENETTAYTEIFPTLGKADLYPKYVIELAVSISANKSDVTSLTRLQILLLPSQAF